MISDYKKVVPLQSTYNLQGKKTQKDDGGDDGFLKNLFLIFLRKEEHAIFLESNDSQILQKAEYNVGKVCPLNNHDSC